MIRTCPVAFRTRPFNLLKIKEMVNIHLSARGEHLLRHLPWKRSQCPWEFHEGGLVGQIPTNEPGKVLQKNQEKSDTADVYRTLIIWCKKMTSLGPVATRGLTAHIVIIG